MNGVGLSIQSALLLVVAGWILVALCYRLRDRRRHIVVAHLLPWKEFSPGTRSARLRYRLRLVASIALQLVVVALLAMATLDPNVASGPRELRHQVILIDTSRSMAAKEGSVTRWQLLRPRVLDVIRSLDDSTEVLLAAADRQATPLLPWTRDQHELLRAVERIEPTESASDVHACLSTAAEYLSGKAQPALLIGTDASRASWQAVEPIPELANIPVQAILAGNTDYNLGIVVFTARQRPDAARTVELLIELVNDDDQDHDVALEFTSANRILRVESTRVQAKQRRKLTFADVGDLDHTVTARLRILDGPRDALESDDVAYAALPDAQNTRVAIVTRGSLYLEAAVLSDDSLQPELVAPGAPLDARRFDLAIYHDSNPPLPLTLPTFLVNPPPDNPLVQVRPGLEAFGFDTWDARNPMLNGLDLYDVQVDHGMQLLPGPTDRGLAYSGSKAILVSGIRDSQPWVALGFDASRSDFVLRPSWPLFVRQVLTALMGRSVAEVRTTQPFDVVHLPAPATAPPATLYGPNGSARTLAAVGTEYSFVPEATGIYRVEAGSGSAFVAVNLGSVSESRITPTRPLRVSEREIRPPIVASSRRRQPRFVYLTAAVLVLLLFETVSFHRRWSV